MLTLDSSDVLTGTWLDRGKPLPGLFFLLLLLLLVPPPPLIVLPPDILRFRRLFGACLDGSATRKTRRQTVTDTFVMGLCGWECVYLLSMLFTYLVAPPSFAISGRGRSWGSLWGWGCMSCVWTSAPAWAPESHTAGGENKKRQQVKDYTVLKIIRDALIDKTPSSAGVPLKLRHLWLEILRSKNNYKILEAKT